jgi:hypothetical protein
MSPHNHARFNGSNINAPHSYHTNQNDLAIAFDNAIHAIGRFVYSKSGLKSFYTRRFFERGIKNPSMYYDDKYIQAEQYIVTNHNHRWGNIGSFPHIKK